MTEIVIMKVVAFIITAYCLVNLVVDMATLCWGEFRNEFVDKMLKTRENVENFVMNHFLSMVCVHLMVGMLFLAILIVPVSEIKNSQEPEKIEQNEEIFERL